jgi:hypothetical protein
MASPGNTASIEIVGLYSLSADHERYRRFIREKIVALEPSTFHEKPRKEQMEILYRRGGRADQPLTDEERSAHEAQLRELSLNAAVIEALVDHPDATFDVGAFVQPDPAKSSDQWKVAWNETFLTADGETRIDLQRRQKIPDLDRFRVVFVIHFWKPHLPLRSSYGELPLPPIRPLPERLWQLAPYDWPD